MARQWLPPLAELIDRMTIVQIKEVKFDAKRDLFAAELKALCHDIDGLIQERKLPLTAKLLRSVVVIAQMNLHIWHLKDVMSANRDTNPEIYKDALVLSHQLNGLKNGVKNMLLQETGDIEECAQRTNWDTDGLKGWNISL